jgi:hypothetical protein
MNQKIKSMLPLVNGVTSYAVGKTTMKKNISRYVAPPTFQSGVLPT